MTLMDRIRQARKVGGFRALPKILAGKAIGLLLVYALSILIQHCFFGVAHAAGAAPIDPDAPYISPINTAWTLAAAFLVFFMQAGFMCLEAGFSRSREAINIILEGIVDTCLCGVLFWCFGFGFMFGAGNGWIGQQYFMLHGTPKTYGSTGVPMLAFWLFQFAFADTCSTITSGAMVGRTGFIGDILYSIGVSGFIYPIFGHWAWGPDGWLNSIHPAAFHDFAGSTVVHTIGGFIALAGAIVLGPRLGRKFKRDGGQPMLPHDLTIAVSGGLILWFGWYGFNPGSTLSAMDFVGIGRVATNTTLAACAAGLTSIIYGYWKMKTWDAGYTTNGFLAGLVAITCPCYWVSPTGAVLLGGIAGVIVIMGVDLLEWLRIDDPIGAVPVHGFAGIWGTLSLGLFACGQYGATGPIAPDNSAPLKGLFYGGGLQVLKAQFIGSACITLATFGVAMVVMLIVNAMGMLRLPAEMELYGMDLHEHGISAYPEYVISALGAPAGMSQELPLSPMKASVSPSKTLTHVG